MLFINADDIYCTTLYHFQVPTNIPIFHQMSDGEVTNSSSMFNVLQFSSRSNPEIVLSVSLPLPLTSQLYSVRFVHLPLNSTQFIYLPLNFTQFIYLPLNSTQVHISTS